MNAEQIAAVMAQAAGDPGVGPVAEAIPAMAQAVAHALAPDVEAIVAPQIKVNTKG